MNGSNGRCVRLLECLEEVTAGVGDDWHRYRVVGATRDGLAPAKERVGKSPQRYKLVEPGTIFYNPMRILLGSIALVDEGQEPGITSPDYVVFKARPQVIHPRWFYYWLRSDEGAAFIRSLARGAVRERMLFRRLATAEVEVPPFESQTKFALAMEPLERARAAVERQLEIAARLPAAHLRATFEDVAMPRWPTKPLGGVCRLLPSKSIATDGETLVQAITTACLDEGGFRPEGIKPARMRATDVAECVVGPGEILVARSNTPELVGRACIFEGHPSGVVASDLTIRLEAGPEIHSSFVAAFLSFLFMTGYWRERAGGASGSMKKITRTQLENQPLPVPGMDEQLRIAQGLRRTLSETRRIRQALEAQVQSIEATRSALLRRAFSGAL